MGNWSFGPLGNSKNTSIMNKPTGRLEKPRWVEPWYLSYAILGCTMGGMFPILIPLLALKHFSSACQVGLVMAAFNLGGLMAPIWGSIADRYGIHRVWNRARTSITYFCGSNGFFRFFIRIGRSLGSSILPDAGSTELFGSATDGLYQFFLSGNFSL